MVDLPLYQHPPLTRVLARTYLEGALDRYKTCGARLDKVERAVTKMVDAGLKIPRVDVLRIRALLAKVKSDMVRAGHDMEGAIDLFIAAHIRAIDLLAPVG